MLGKRLKAAWATLRGRVYIPKAPKVIYVQSENRRGFVQLAPFQDLVLALAADGSLWCLHREFGQQFVCELVMTAPGRR